MRSFASDDDRSPSSAYRYLDLLPSSSSRDAFYPASAIPNGPETAKVEIGDLFRRYRLLLFAMVLIGSAGGIASVILVSPVYKSRVMIEVQGVNEAWLKNSFDTASTYDSNEVGIQTQIQLLKGGPFLRRVLERLQSETVPLAPVGSDIFSRLRQKVRPSTQDPMQNVRKGLEEAIDTFDARPINRTRLIELTCDSSSPEVAAQFVNTMATEFIEETLRSRMQTSQKTGEWLAGQIEETKTKLQEAEERLQEFVQVSGNLFVSQDTTLDDAKLAQLRAELSKIQADRIGKQTKYELVMKSPPEALPEILDDAGPRGYQYKLNELRREKASLEMTYTAQHPKMTKLNAQISILQSNLRNELNGVFSRIRNEYEAALRQEKSLADAYSAQSERVTAMAGKASQHNALRREVETMRQMYQSLLMQSNQTGLSNSVPVNPIHLVEPSTPPREPYKPKPILNISFGIVVGLALTGGIVFLREHMDESVRFPGLSRSLLNAPELGVIPSAAMEGRSNGLFSRLLRKDNNGFSLVAAPKNVRDVSFWNGESSVLAESFRGALASLLRDTDAECSRTILITSSSVNEGKTMVAANLGIALVETGRKVLLIDADFRRPRLHNVFQVGNDHGTLYDLLMDKTAVDSYSAESLGFVTSIPGLAVLPNRASRQNVSRLLYSSRLPALIARLREQFDMVLIDAPPILDLADARIVARFSDGVILVLRAGMTSRARALEAYQRICDDGLKVVGTVLNDWSPSKAQMKRHYYSYADPEK
jgi:polysaccharide biosynthesis transport protein